MNNIQKLKQYFLVAKPNKWYVLLDLAMWLLFYIIGIYAAVPSANAINSISIGDLKGTIIWLLVTCGVVVVQQIINVITDRIYYKIRESVYYNINSQIYDKISHAKAESFLETSKEKILNTVNNNINHLADFPHNLLKYVSYFVQALITIIILLKNNLIIGAVIIVVCVLLYFVLDAINKVIAKWRTKHFAFQDKSLEGLSDNYANRELTSDLNLTQSMRNKYLTNLDASQTAKMKFGMHQSTANNWIPVIYQTIICALSVYMVILTKSSIFTLTLYLVLTKYLTQAITQMTSSYGVLSEINEAHVEILRVKNILNMPTEDLINFGKNTSDEIDGSIVFTNTSYQSKSADHPECINSFNLKLSKNSSTLFYGAPKCGKRWIFNLLNRSVRPTTGTITIDNINIYDFDQETYKHNVAASSSKEYFYNDTIMKNLLLSGASKQQIYKVCKDLGLHKKIVGSKNAYNTNLTKEPNVLNNFETYLLGIARALCTNSEIIVIYEFPSGLSDSQKDTLKNVLKNIATEHTLIVFSHNDWAKNVCKNVYKVEKGKISRQTN